VVIEYTLCVGNKHCIRQHWWLLNRAFGLVLGVIGPEEKHRIFPRITLALGVYGRTVVIDLCVRHWN